MKFGKALLAFAADSGVGDSRFMNYKQLKQLIKAAGQISEGHPADRQLAMNEFQDLLAKEVQRVNAYFLTMAEVVVGRRQILQDTLSSLRFVSMMNSAARMSAEQALVQLRQDTERILAFADTNGTGFRKIVKKFDKKLKQSTLSQFLHGSLMRDQPIFQWISRLTEVLSSVDEALSRLRNPTTDQILRHQLVQPCLLALHRAVQLQTEISDASNDLKVAVSKVSEMMASSHCVYDEKQNDLLVVALCAVHDGVACGNAQAVIVLLENLPEALSMDRHTFLQHVDTCVNHEFLNAVMIASKFGHSDILHILISCGCLPGRKDYMGRTSLMESSGYTIAD